ncbi:MAG TPA: FAD-dependent thymidylate synthase [Atribacteraceae bacterium]|nr:FAD-dependent thymidylate synthase [Atribacteraceae bacterium]
MNVTLIAHTPDPENIIAQAARTCYGTAAKASLGKMAQQRLIRELVKRGHESVLEHACFTFSVEGISRTASHQLVRHRLASFSQQSQRYVRLDPPAFIMPSSITLDPQASALFSEACQTLTNTYQKLIGLNIPREDARLILPQAVTTSLVMTVNARELLHIFRVRLCRRAQWEIQEVCLLILEIVEKLAPAVFQEAGPPCVHGPCPEGEKGCRHPWIRRLS